MKFSSILKASIIKNKIMDIENKTTRLVIDTIIYQSIPNTLRPTKIPRHHFYALATPQE